MSENSVPRRFCQGCFEKQIEIDRLKEEVVLLKARLRYQSRSGEEGFWGSSTPSSQIPLKPNSPQHQQRKRGGASPGHPGHGRQAVNESEADHVVEINSGDICPECGGNLKESKGYRSRTVIDIQPIKTKKILYRISRKRCTQCGHIYQGKVPGVLPNFLFGNELLTHIVVQHYIYGVTLGRLEEQFGINIGSIIGVLHRLAQLLKDIPDSLILEYRQSPVKHADETGWRHDGHSGYSWLFCTLRVSIFRFRNTRSSQIPLEVLGSQNLPGVLVVDRYNAYNKAPVALQYCYAHLLRETEDLEKEFPTNAEVSRFVSVFIPLLVQAMRLRSQDIPDKIFYRQALVLKGKILDVVQSNAKHPSIQRIQNIFRDNAHRLYHWANDRSIPAENNLVERELRPTVIARKVSFGSQSDEGAKTREIIMTVLHTLKKCTPDFTVSFKSALDKLSLNPSVDLYRFLFPRPHT